jgi:hypothetical protein
VVLAPLLREAHAASIWDSLRRHRLRHPPERTRLRWRTWVTPGTSLTTQMASRRTVFKELSSQRLQNPVPRPCCGAREFCFCCLAASPSAELLRVGHRNGPADASRRSSCPRPSGRRSPPFERVWNQCDESAVDELFSPTALVPRRPNCDVSSTRERSRFFAATSRCSRSCLSLRRAILATGRNACSQPNQPLQKISSDKTKPNFSRKRARNSQALSQMDVSPANLRH